jgi:hypothetical protein
VHQRDSAGDHAAARHEIRPPMVDSKAANGCHDVETGANTALCVVLTDCLSPPDRDHCIADELRYLAPVTTDDAAG